MKKLNVVELAKLLKRFNDIAIVFHKNPDGDALGSALALSLGLRQLGRRCKILGLSDIPARFEFLFENFEVDSSFGYRHVVAVDLASFSLIDDELKNLKINLVIDHHLKNDVESEFGFVESDAAATCELIYAILIELGVKIDKMIALALYVGLATDTGCFKFANTTAKTHKIAASLLDKGINFADVNFVLFDLKTKEQLSLQSLALNKLQLLFGGLCAIVFITQKMLKSCRCVEADVFVVVDLLRSIAGVEVAIVIKETVDGSFKGSVRTRSFLSASKFCELFGGGGHEKAAGFVLEGEFSDVKIKLLKKLKEFVSIEGRDLC